MPQMRRTDLIWIIAALALCVIVRATFFREPLERDEGAYAYIGQEIRRGRVPYVDAWDHKPPMVHFIYALAFTILDEEAYAVRLAGMASALAATVLVWLVARRLFGPRAAHAAAILFALFSSMPRMQGSGSNTETFVAPFLLLAFLLYLRADERRRIGLLIVSGIAAGLAAMTKQVAAAQFLAIPIVIVIYDLIAPSRRPAWAVKALAVLLVGVALGVLPFIIYFAAVGALGEMIFAVVTYNFLYVGGLSYSGIAVEFDGQVVRENALLWLLGVGGLIGALADRIDRRTALAAIWLLLGVFTITLGKRFYPHYFILLVPACACLGGCAIDRLTRGLAARRAVAFAALIPLALAAWLLVAADYQYFFVLSADRISVEKYRTDAFVVMRDLGRVLRERVSEGETIYLWGSEPELYFHARRRCPTRVIYLYPILGGGDFGRQAYRETLDGLKARPPAVFVRTDFTDAFPELHDFVKRNYALQDKIRNYEVAVRKDLLAPRPEAP